MAESLKTQFPSTEELNQLVAAEIAKVSNLDAPSIDVLKTIYGCIDLTSLNSTDGPTSIDRWIDKAVFGVLSTHADVKPGAICVYPNFARLVKTKLKDTGIKTAVVSTCFPTGQTFQEVKDLETRLAVEQGADEIDMVVSRGYWNEDFSEKVLNEIQTQKAICGTQAALKVILETCELTSLASIYKLSYQALESGADFIKTSTGKGTHGATLEHYTVMCLALRDFINSTGSKRGIKAAGGIADAVTAQKFLTLTHNLLGQADSNNFRIGASSLANKILDGINNAAHGKQDLSQHEPSLEKKAKEY